jgi:polyamine oxidase
MDMVVDYYKYDSEFGEPPRVTSLQNTVPLPTFSDFGDDVYFVADQRGYGSVVYYIAGQYLETDRSGKIVDPRLQFNKVVHSIFNPLPQICLKKPLSSQINYMLSVR